MSLLLRYLKYEKYGENTINIINDIDKWLNYYYVLLNPNHYVINNAFKYNKSTTILNLEKMIIKG